MQAKESGGIESKSDILGAVVRELFKNDGGTLKGEGFRRKLASLSFSGFERSPFFLNDGNGRFRNIAPVIGIDSVLDSRSAASADIDGDGDLDLFMRNLRNPRILYYENVVPDPGNYIRVKLRGTKSNRDAVGATVLVVTENHRQLQTLCAGAGFLTQHSSVLHFGLGKEQTVKSIRVTWPGGKTQGLENQSANQTLTVVEK